MNGTDRFISWLESWGCTIFSWSCPFPTQVEGTLPDGTVFYYRQRGYNGSLHLGSPLPSADAQSMLDALASGKHFVANVADAYNSAMENKVGSARFQNEAWVDRPGLTPEEHQALFQALFAHIEAEKMAKIGPPAFV